MHINQSDQNMNSYKTEDNVFENDARIEYINIDSSLSPVMAFLIEEEEVCTKDLISEEKNGCNEDTSSPIEIRLEKEFIGAAKKRLSQLLLSQKETNDKVEQKPTRRSRYPQKIIHKKVSKKRQIVRTESTLNAADTSKSSKEISINVEEASTNTPTLAPTTPDTLESQIKVGIIHYNYPNTLLTKEQLEILQQAILLAVEQIPDHGPQVRFENCSCGRGWLLLSCADMTSTAWLKDVIEQLQPWEGVRLKLVQGEDIPKPHVYMAFLPDDLGYPLSPNQVLKRLRNMNHGLNTNLWLVLSHVRSKGGQTWTFSIDEGSIHTLEKVNFMPYFGFGQVVFQEVLGSPKEEKLNGLT